MSSEDAYKEQGLLFNEIEDMRKSKIPEKRSLKNAGLLLSDKEKIINNF